MNEATRRRRTPAVMFQDAIQRVYDRHGTRGLIVVGYTTVASAVAAADFFVMIMLASYAEITFAEAWPFALAHVGLSLVGLVVGALVSRRSIAVWLSWSRGARNADRAAEFWNEGRRARKVLVVRTCAVLYVMIAVLGLPTQYAVWDMSYNAYLVQLGALAVIVTTGGIAAWLFIELLMRPGLLDVAAYLPADFVPRDPALSLLAKAILPIPGIVLFTGPAVGGLIDTNQGYQERLFRAFLASAVIALVAVGFYYVLAHAVLDPIDQLTEATRRVGAGDLETRVPLVSPDELGMLAISFNQMLDGLQERERLRAQNTALSTALDESLDEVRASRARIVAAADEERRRVERDLHDGAQQRLVMISLKLAMAADLLDKDPAGAAALHEELRSDASRAVEELRDLAHGIYPPLLESDGLASALEDIADQSPRPVIVEADGTGRYPAPIEAAVYFCCLEALQNATKYAGPSCRITVRLGQADGALGFSVVDDGIGFDMSVETGNAGLQNMADRIGALGGTMRITSAPGHGTKAEGTVPV